VDLQSKVASFYIIMAGRPPTYRETREYFEDEVDELLEALSGWEEGGDEDLEHIAKEIGDVAFCLVAVAEALGIEFEEACDIVADSNMTKQPTRGGKVKKGNRYQEPDMRRAIL